MFVAVSCQVPNVPVGDVHLDALGRRAEPGVFPVVDRARAVGGQVREPVPAIIRSRSSAAPLRSRWAP